MDIKLGAFFFKNCYAVLGPGIVMTELGEDQPFGRFRVIMYPLCGVGYEFIEKEDQTGFCVEAGLKGRAVYFTTSIVMVFKSIKAHNPSR